MLTISLILLCAIILYVKISQKHFSCRQQWLQKPLSSGPYHAHLSERGSLTASLQRRYRRFAVTSLKMDYAKANLDEAQLLHLAQYQHALIREVVLYGNAHPVVFAHSVLPRSSIKATWLGLGRLGNQPLGATLFANPKIKRTPLNYKKLTANHVLYWAAIKTISHKPHFLWARRSIFSLGCANIMVTEVFLPDLLLQP